MKNTTFIHRGRQILSMKISFQDSLIFKTGIWTTKLLNGDLQVTLSHDFSCNWSLPSINNPKAHCNNYWVLRFETPQPFWLSSPAIVFFNERIERKEHPLLLFPTPPVNSTQSEVWWWYQFWFFLCKRQKRSLLELLQSSVFYDQCYFHCISRWLKTDY